jgi:PAS domain S-box-containing protein/putative nucleotidyltransferase with HDIG domain
MMFLVGHDEPALVNRALADFLGYDRERFDKMPAVDVMERISHPDDYRKEVTLLHELVGRERPSYTIEKRFVREDGSVVFGLQTTTFFFDDAGTFRFGVSSIQDITNHHRTREQLQAAYEGAIDGLVAALESRDPYTVGHQHRVAQLACAIAAELELPEHQTSGLRVASTLHDIGKIAIPAEILTKPYGMSDVEFELVKKHPKVAYDILKEISFPWPVADIVLQHHERMDGSGYPEGLIGEEILLEARIIAVADTVEALASHRPYRPAVKIDDVLRHINEHRATLFDAQAVDACLRVFEDGFAFMEAGPIPEGRKRLV